MAHTEGQDSGPAPQQPEVPEDLARCAMVVEHAIEHLHNEKFPDLAIASALLGGSLGVLARSMDPQTILRILDSAANSVRMGDVHASVTAAENAQGEKD